MAEMEKKTVNAMGDVCPVPLVKAKNAIAELAGSGKVEVLVDNEIAVQNLEKMAQQKGYGFLVKEKKEKEYHVEFTVPSGILDERQNTVASDTDTEIYLFNLTDRSYDVVRHGQRRFLLCIWKRKTDRYFKLPGRGRTACR